MIGAAAEATRSYVRAWLTEIETVLAKGATSPLDFTLHDDEHSFRVAQRMFELIPTETADNLSDFEWALLLQAAYLHDIGMNPRREVLQQVRHYLLSGSGDSSFGGEAERLQQWLDEAEPGVQPPIYPDIEVGERVEKAEYLTAFFARHRHNDWSGDFITSEAVTRGFPPYPTWIEDLVTLCKSHHYGLEELMQQKFDLRIAGPGGKLVNLRYLAALLRVADVLKFDPERTPPVIFRLRNIGPKSRIFWYKDQAIVLAINHESRNLLFTARTRNAWVHKAVIETADAVDVELQNCAAIEQQGGFARGVKLDPKRSYHWPWPTKMARDIKPVDDTFVYVNGAFRPEPHRVIALLAGTRLYGTPLAALRELLQNAFDAVREQIAHQSLADPAYSDATLEALGLLHRVDLLSEGYDGRTWLICRDTGVGMTRTLIERHLLVSGSQPRPEVLQLQRRCRASRIRFERSGEFGIGVLSYFMIADKVSIPRQSRGLYDVSRS